LFREAGRAENIRCSGCTGDLTGLFVYCDHCRVRSFAMQRGHDTRATCTLYDTCGVLVELPEAAPEPKPVLEPIRRNESHEGAGTFK